MRARFDAKAQPLLEADGAQDARRVLDKAQRVQDADHAVAQVLFAAKKVEQLAPVLAIQADGQGIDRKVAAVQILLDRRTLDLGQRRGVQVKLCAGGDKVQRLAVLQDPLGGAKTVVRAHPSPSLGGQLPRQVDGVALDHQVRVVIGASEQQVADKAADDVQGIPERLGARGGPLEQLQAAGGHHLLQRVNDLTAARLQGAVVGRQQQPDQVGAGHNAEDLPLARDHGHLAHPMLDHYPLQGLDRIVGPDLDAPLGHVHRDGRVAQPQAPGALGLASGQDAHHPVPVQDGKALVSIALHQRAGLVDRGRRIERVHAIGHDLAHGHRRLHTALEQLQQALPRLFQVHLPDQGRRSPAVSPPAHIGGDAPDVDGIAGRAGDQLDLVVKLDQEKEPGRLPQVAQLVGQDRHLFDVTGKTGRGNDHRLPGIAMALVRLDQALVQLALVGGQRVMQKIVGDVQPGALFQQPGDAAHVTRRGGVIRERTGVLIDAQQVERGLDRRQVGPLPDDLFEQQGRRRAQRLAAVGPSGGQVAGQGMVVNDLHLDARVHAPDRDQRLGVDQDHSFDLGPGQVLDGSQAQLGAVEGHKVAHVAVDAPGQDRDGFRVEPGRGDQGREGVKVGVFVGQDDGHMVGGHGPPLVGCDRAVRPGRKIS